MALLLFKLFVNSLTQIGIFFCLLKVNQYLAMAYAVLVIGRAIDASIMMSLQKASRKEFEDATKEDLEEARKQRLKDLNGEK